MIYDTIYIIMKFKKRFPLSQQLLKSNILFTFHKNKIIKNDKTFTSEEN